MLTIKENITNEYEIKKSKFITLLYKIDDVKEVNEILENVKGNYKDATHYCYSYKLDNTEKFSDDKEPSGTAGLPMMEVLNKRGLNHILCIVIRYFGGIKLGAGGLVRAYTKSVTECLKKTNILEFEYGYKLDIIFSYDERKIMENILNNYQIVNKIYQDNITYTITCNELEFNTLKENNYNICNINKILIKK